MNRVLKSGPWLLRFYLGLAVVLVPGILARLALDPLSGSSKPSFDHSAKTASAPGGADQYFADERQ